MAIWQFDVQLMPAVIVPDADSYIAASMTEDGLDTDHWWRFNQPPANYAEIIASRFPRKDSWDNELLQWGAEKGLLVELWLDDFVVSSISARLALPHICADDVANFCELVGDLHSHIHVMETQAVVGPLPTLLQPHIETSRAAKFCSDPKGFFDNFDGNT